MDFQIKKQLELPVYRELLKNKAKYNLGDEVYAIPQEYGRDTPFMPCTVIGVYLMSDMHGTGYYYSLIYHHEHEEQTGWMEGVACNLIETEVPEYDIRKHLD